MVATAEPAPYLQDMAEYRAAVADVGPISWPMSAQYSWRVRTSLASALLIGLVVVPVAAPTPARTATAVAISVSGYGAHPKLAHARVGQAVTWTNATASAHRVGPGGSGFAAFTLLAHGQHTVRFIAPGRYAYRVDGRWAAVVVVVVSGGPPKPKPPAGPRKLLTTWSGTFHSDAASNGGAGYQACSTRWTGKVRFTVSSRGVAGGTGTANEIPGTATCALALDPKRITGASFTVHGAATATDLSLTFTLTALRGGPGGDGSGFVTHLAKAPTYKLPIDSRGHARAAPNFSYPFGNGGTITTHDTLDLNGS
jgi:plastocyanin